MRAVYKCGLLAWALAVGTSAFAQLDDTYKGVGWTADSSTGICSLHTLKPRSKSVKEFLELEYSKRRPPFVQIIDRGGEYEFTVNFVAVDDLQFRIWSAGGYTSNFTAPTGQSFVLTPALSHISSSYLAAAGNPTDSIWMDTFKFDTETRVFSASTRLPEKVGFEFLIERAESGFLYAFVPSDMNGETAWQIGDNISFRAALASFVKCLEGVSG